MTARSNFTMTPNIAFDVLTNEYDLVGYQKLLRVVGMGNVWKGGNHALADKLNTSYGRIVKLKDALKKIGFIEIIPGDNAHGEADGWLIVDIWDRNISDDTLSPNEQGQDSETTEDFNALPCHETNNPLSPNGQGSLSRNEQHKEKIVLKGSFKDLSLSSRARACSPDFIQTIKNGLKIRIGVPEVLPDEENWLRTIDFAFSNEFDEERFLKTYDALEKIRKLKRGKWKITAKMIENNIAQLEKLELEIFELETNKMNKNGKKFTEPNKPPDNSDEDVFDTGDVIGLTVEKATEAFKEVGYSLRVTRIDGVACVVTKDFKMNRINVSVKGDEVIEILCVG